MRHPVLTCILALTLGAPAVAGPLDEAAKKGDVAQVVRLLAAGGDPDRLDGIAAPLHWAAMNGHARVVQALAEGGADLELQSEMLGTPLHAAARFGRVASVEALLAAGADPNLRDRDQFTPLMRAVVENRAEAVGVLLAADADVNAVGNAPGGITLGLGPTIALQLALHQDRDEIAEMLRQAGAGPIPPAVPADILTSGDPGRGRELAYTYCEECHILEAGDAERLGTGAGPPLIGVAGRPVADLPEYPYSEALIAHGGAWTPERLYAFALAPTLTVPGTRMNWAPDRTPEMIADITAYFTSVAR